MLTILLLLLLIPLFLTIFCQKMQLEELLGNVNRTAETEEDADMLFCIVAKEISADAPEECIKAQCVIARTNLKAAEEMGTELPGSMTMGELQELWGDYFSEAEGKIKEAIQETDGETLQYRNHYIYAAYHAVSAGNTRNMEELYPDADMPYLSGVACYEDAQAPDYLSVLYLDQEITIEEKDSAGYVKGADEWEILHRRGTAWGTWVKIRKFQRDRTGTWQDPDRNEGTWTRIWPEPVYSTENG